MAQQGVERALRSAARPWRPDGFRARRSAEGPSGAGAGAGGPGASDMKRGREPGSSKEGAALGATRPGLAGPENREQRKEPQAGPGRAVPQFPPPGAGPSLPPPRGRHLRPRARWSRRSPPSGPSPARPGPPHLLTARGAPTPAPRAAQHGAAGAASPRPRPLQPGHRPTRASRPIAARGSPTEPGASLDRPAPSQWSGFESFRLIARHRGPSANRRTPNLTLSLPGLTWGKLVPINPLPAGAWALPGVRRRALIPRAGAGLQAGTRAPA